MVIVGLQRFRLDIITNNVTFANTFTNVEPENNFHGYQGVEPSFAYGNILVGTSASSGHQTANALTNSWNVSGSWWGQLNLGVFHEGVQLGSSLDQES